MKASDITDAVEKLKRVEPPVAKFNMSKWTSDVFKKKMEEQVQLVKTTTRKQPVEGLLGMYSGVPFFEVPWLADGFLEMVMMDGKRQIIDLNVRS